MQARCVRVTPLFVFWVYDTRFPHRDRNDLPVHLTSDIDADFQSATGIPVISQKHSDLGKIRNDGHTQRDVSTSFKR